MMSRLGKTPDAIFSSLTRLGIKGYRYSYRDNPLSKYVMSQRFYNGGIGLSLSYRIANILTFAISIGEEKYQYFEPSECPCIAAPHGFLALFYTTDKYDALLI